MRRKAQARRPEASDLDVTQRRIYNALPSELKIEFLATLPDISIPGVLTERKVAALEKRISEVKDVAEGLRSYSSHLQEVIARLKNGASPEAVDLRRELNPPELPHVQIRLVRSKRGGG